MCSLLYGAEDPSIAGMVLDSAFSNLFDLMMELVDVYKIRLPKFTVKVAVQYMRRIIQKKAKFNIMDLNCVKVSPKTFIPALFGHASGDKFIQPHHSDLILKCYAGDKNIIKFDGDHNSSRPQSYYDSVLVFFYNVLRPPPISSSYSSKLESYYSLGDVNSATGLDEVICTPWSNPKIQSCVAFCYISAFKYYRKQRHCLDILLESLKKRLDVYDG
jgi:hypothetical protein